jgi:hypothetical protein
MYSPLGFYRLYIKEGSMVKKKLLQGFMFYPVLLCVHLIHTTAIDSCDYAVSERSTQIEQVQETTVPAPEVSTSFAHEFDIDEEDGMSVAPQEQSKTQKLLHAVLVKALNVYFLCQSSVDYITSRTLVYYTACKNLLLSSK